MSKYNILISSLLLVIATASIFAIVQKKQNPEDRFVSYIVDAQKQDIKFYWKNDQQEIFENIQHLKNWLEKDHKTLVFATNGGMYKADNIPQGLFIENQKTITPLDTTSGKGNFYLKPNGVFYITTDNMPSICKTTDFADNENIKYATQSGPMLVVDGQIHPEFRAGSKNLNIRNGVGILPDQKIIFAMSKKEINLYDFAKYFQSLGCNNALYLDGFVSRTYLPEQNWIQTDGDFGVIIGVTTF